MNEVYVRTNSDFLESEVFLFILEEAYRDYAMYGIPDAGDIFGFIDFDDFFFESIEDDYVAEALLDLHEINPEFETQVAGADLYAWRSSNFLTEEAEAIGAISFIQEENMRETQCALEEWLVAHQIFHTTREGTLVNEVISRVW